MSYGFSVEAQHHCSSRDLVHARLRSVERARPSTIGNEEYFYFEFYLNFLYLVHARVRRANEAVENGKDIYLASECKKEDRQRRDDRGHVRFDPSVFSLYV